MTSIHGHGAHGRDIAHDLAGCDVLVSWRDDGTGENDPCFSPAHAIVGINDGHTRKRIAETCGYPGGTWVHTRAIVGHGVTLGAHSHVNAGAFLTRCTLGSYCTVGPNATVCGDVTIGDLVTIGAGATIANLVTICDDVTIGAGAVVVDSITEPGIYVGVPARRVR